MNVVRTIVTSTPPEQVFAYLKDFTTTTEWDPGTIRTTRVSGDGGVGTTYANVSEFRGRETRLTYVVQAADAPHLLQLRGENDTVVATDTMTMTPTPAGGTELTYNADFRFKGVARLAAPFLAPAFKRLGDEAEEGLRRALG